MTPSKDQITLSGELAILGILRQGKMHHAFPLIIEIQARQKACLRRVTITSVEEGQEMMQILLGHIKKAHMLVIIPGPDFRGAGLKTWTVNPQGFHSETVSARPEIIARKRVIA